MLDLNSLYNQIETRLGASCCVVSDITLKLKTSERNKTHIPLALIHNSAVVVFLEFDDCSEANFSKVANTFRTTLNYLVQKMDLSVNSFLFYGFNNQNEEEGLPLGLCRFNAHNDRINYFLFDEQYDDFVDLIVGDIKSRYAMFEDKEIENIAFNLEVSGGSNGEIKKDSEGNRYIKRHGQWCLASDLDSDDMFKKASLFGAFGAHKILEQKRSTGMLYLFTCGLFGIGWLFDCLSLLFGIYKDVDGRYLLPVTDRKACLIKMLIGFGITLIYIVLYTFLINYLSTILNSFVDGALSKKDNETISYINSLS